MRNFIPNILRGFGLLLVGGGCILVVIGPGSIGVTDGADAVMLTVSLLVAGAAVWAIGEAIVLLRHIAERMPPRTYFTASEDR